MFIFFELAGGRHDAMITLNERPGSLLETVARCRNVWQQTVVIIWAVILGGNGARNEKAGEIIVTIGQSDGFLLRLF